MTAAAAFCQPKGAFQESTRLCKCVCVCVCVCVCSVKKLIAASCYQALKTFTQVSGHKKVNKLIFYVKVIGILAFNDTERFISAEPV